jgi:hypothetical protein
MFYLSGSGFTINKEKRVYRTLEFGVALGAKGEVTLL